MNNKLTHCMCGCIYEEPECPRCNKITDKDRIKELEKRINDLSADKINLRSENMELKAKLSESEALLAKAEKALMRIGSGEFSGQMLTSMPPQDAAAYFARTPSQN